MAVCHVFWLDENYSEKDAHFIAKKINRKIRQYGFEATPLRTTQDFILTDYNPDEKMEFYQYRNRVTQDCMEKFKDEFGAFSSLMGMGILPKLHLNLSNPTTEQELYIVKRLNRYKEKHPTLMEQIPIKKGRVCLMILVNVAGLPEMEELLKKEQINYTRVTEWVDETTMKEEYTEVIEL